MGIPLPLNQVLQQTPSVTYTATAGQTTYPYPFAITQDSDLVLVINDITYATDAGYTLSGQGNDTGGYLTLNTPSELGDQVTIYRDVSIERLTQFAQNSGFSSTAFNAEFNRLYLIAQQLENAIQLCLNLPITNAGNPIGASTLTPAEFAGKYMSFDANGNPVPALLTSSTITAGLVGSFLYPTTAQETAANVVPADLQFPPGDLRRYGATGGPAGAIPSADDSAAFAIAVKTGLVIIPKGMAFKVVTQGTTYSGKMQMLGYGNDSQLYCDGIVLEVTNGDFSTFSNFYMEPISTPFVIQRNVVSTTSTTANTIGPNTFTSDVSGLQAGTLTTAVTPGTYTCRVQDGEIRNITVASGGTACTWTGALSTTSGPILSVGFCSFTVANGSMIATGATVYGMSQCNGTTVRGVSGNVVTVADPCSYTSTNAPVQFYDITFNTGSTCLATGTNTKADGFRPPAIVDQDIYSSLTPTQITQSEIGPILMAAGNHIVMEKIYGRFIQLEIDDGNYCTVRDCDFKAGLGSNGHGYGGIVFINTGTTRCFGNAAVRNRVREAGNEGIFMQGCTQAIITDNFVYGCGDSGIEFYGDVPGGTPLDTYYTASNAVTSANNVCIGNSQGGINYSSNGAGIVGFNIAMGSSTGDYCAWQQYGAAGFTGDGWTVTGLNCEYNGGPAIYYVGNRSTFSNITCRENQYNNYGVFPIIAVLGQGNLVNNIRVWQDTNRCGNASMEVYASGITGYGDMLGLANSLVNIDLRDAQTAANECLLLVGLNDLFNVRTNGAPYDQSIESLATVQLMIASSAITPDLSKGSKLYVNVASNAAFTINNPINCPPNKRWYLEIVNISGGSLGTITWGSQYKLAGNSYTAPASACTRASGFCSNGATPPTEHKEWFRSAGDIPN